MLEIDDKIHECSLVENVCMIITFRKSLLNFRRSFLEYNG